MVQEFAAGVATLRTPLSVLDGLSKLSRECDVQPCAAWFLPRGLIGFTWRWHPGETLFVDRHVSKDFFPRYRQAFEANGFSFMSLKARLASLPFTFAEAEKEAKATRSRNQWIFPFMRGFNMNDGLYCSYRKWHCIFVSPQLLALSPGQRALLSVAAQFAIGRIETIVVSPRKRGSSKYKVTPREQEVLQQLAVLGDIASVAKALDLTKDAVDAHLRNVRAKVRGQEHRAGAADGIQIPADRVLTLRRRPECIAEVTARIRRKLGLSA